MLPCRLSPNFPSCILIEMCIKCCTVQLRQNIYQTTLIICCCLSPFQAKDTVENAALSVPTLQDEHAAQDVEVQLVFWDRTNHPGLEEGGPLPLQGPLAAPVVLHTGGDDGRMDELIHSGIYTYALICDYNQIITYTYREGEDVRSVAKKVELNVTECLL